MPTRETARIGGWGVERESFMCGQFQAKPHTPHMDWAFIIIIYIEIHEICNPKYGIHHLAQGGQKPSYFGSEESERADADSVASRSVECVLLL